MLDSPSIMVPIQLRLMPPVKAMLAKPVKPVRGVTEADSVDGDLLFEPKWDVFRRC